MDEYACKCLRQGAIKLFWHSGAGMEAVGLGGASMLAPHDYVWYHYRGHGLPYLLGRGGDPKPFFAEHFGKASGCAQGRSGYHVVAPEVGIFGFFGFLGAGLGVAVGYGMSAKRRGEGQAVLCGLGDGTATNRSSPVQVLNLSNIVAVSGGVMLSILVDFFRPVSIFPSKAVPIYAYGLGLVFVLLARVIVRAIQQWCFRYGVGLHNTLIIGSGELAQRIERHRRKTRQMIFSAFSLVTPRTMPAASIRQGFPEILKVRAAFLHLTFCRFLLS